MQRKGLSKKTKTAVEIAVAAIIVVIALIACWNISAWVNREQPKASVDAIREELVPVAKLATYEYSFTEIIQFSDSNRDLLDLFDLPFTGNKFIATIDGVTSIGVNAEEIKFESALNENGEIASVTVVIPHSEVLNTAISHDSLKVYHQQDGLFNAVSVGDYNDLLTKVEEQQAEKIRESRALEKSDERVREIMETHLNAMLGKNVSVEIRFSEEDAHTIDG